MQNLNQIRARHVLKFSNSEIAVRGQNGGEVIKKIPPVIMNNGILAALAYSMDPRQESWKLVFNAIAEHLASEEIAMLPPGVRSSSEMLDYLTGEATSVQLRDITAEVAAWLDFARRLVK